MTTFGAVYLVHFNPFEEPRLQGLEVLNELTTILLLSIVYCFTPLLEKHHHSKIGVLFMAVIVANISTHLFFLVGDLLK